MATNNEIEIREEYVNIIKKRIMFVERDNLKSKKLDDSKLATELRHIIEDILKEEVQ